MRVKEMTSGSATGRVLTLRLSFGSNISGSGGTQGAQFAGVRVTFIRNLLLVAR